MECTLPGAERYGVQIKCIYRIMRAQRDAGSNVIPCTVPGTGTVYTVPAEARSPHECFVVFSSYNENKAAGMFSGRLRRSYENKIPEKQVRDCMNREWPGKGPLHSRRSPNEAKWGSRDIGSTDVDERYSVYN